MSTPPGPAYWLSSLLDLVSEDLIKTLYMVLFFAGVAVTLAFPVFLAKSRGFKLERLSFASFGIAKMFFWTNIAGILYGVITIAALIAP